MNNTSAVAITLAAALLASCGDTKDQPTASATTQPAAAVAGLPANAPAVGAPAPQGAATASGEPQQRPDGVLELRWEHLVPKGYEPDVIMGKYAAQIDQIAEGSPEEDALMEKITAEFDSAPGNTSLSGKRVRLPGFISPLEEKDGKVAEFLLVPYFGACIHQPPPPVNQTLLVRPNLGKSVAITDIYEPVWVVGDMKVETVKTSLANAGYLIENAQLEPYTEADATADDAAQTAGQAKGNATANPATAPQPTTPTPR